jgi:hypothetical protein
MAWEFKYCPADPNILLAQDGVKHKYLCFYDLPATPSAFEGEYDFKFGPDRLDRFIKLWLTYKVDNMFLKKHREFIIEALKWHLKRI